MKASVTFTILPLDPPLVDVTTHITMVRKNTPPSVSYTTKKVVGIVNEYLEREFIIATDHPLEKSSSVTILVFPILPEQFPLHESAPNFPPLEYAHTCLDDFSKLLKKVQFLPIFVHNFQ